MQGQANRPWYAIVAACVGVAMIAAFAFQLGRETATSPPIATVSGLSMSPTFCGSSFHVKCEDCDYMFRVSAEQPDGGIIDSPAPVAVCPYCGNSTDGIDVKRQPGDSIELIPIGVRDDGLPDADRFDVVAIGKNGAPEHPTIKRIIGLPNERIDVRDGDIFVDDKRFRKTFDQFFKTAITVSDSVHSNNGNPWVTPHSWIWKDGAWVSDSNPTAKLAFQPAHVFPGPDLGRSSVTDYNSFDQKSARPLNPVGDLAVSMTARLNGGKAELRIGISDGWREWSTLIVGGEGLVNIYHNGEPIRQGEVISIINENKHKGFVIDFGCFDQQAILRIQGEVVWSMAYEREDSENKESENLLPIQPITIASRFGSISLESLVVRRDLHYLPSTLNIGQSTVPIQLGADEYFVLGDYSPLSIDSRDPNVGPIKAADLLGKVRLMSE